MRGWQGPQGEACKRAGRDKGESQIGSDREKRGGGACRRLRGKPVIG